MTHGLDPWGRWLTRSNWRPQAQEPGGAAEGSDCHAAVAFRISAEMITTGTHTRGHRASVGGTRRVASRTRSRFEAQLAWADSTSASAVAVSQIPINMG